MSAWKKPSRIACRRKDWITVRPSAFGSWPAATMPARSLRRMPSIHSLVSTSRAVSAHSGRGVRKSASPAVFWASSDIAAASRRKSISMVTERARDLHHLPRAQALGIGQQRLDDARHEAHRLDVLGEALAHAGPHHLDGERPLRAVGVEHGRLVDLGDGGRRHRLAEGGEQAETGLPNSCSTTRMATPLREGRHPVLQPLEVAGGGHADDVGAGGQELAELDVGRSEPGQRPFEWARAGIGGDARRSSARPSRSAKRRCGGSLIRVDQREPALAGQHEADMGAAGEVEDRA